MKKIILVMVLIISGTTVLNSCANENEGNPAGQSINDGDDNDMNTEDGLNPNGPGDGYDRDTTGNE